ncbi:hypothetical protein PIROE2DRAFT_13746 [Piromyces sp. E2]|nr:hypothetical protein PIROE2DRAFT_13746 [Piromyces sp. E2]|eukprot:OUM60474.1 hypothetical protein PIROE2DRAFT_13746 [Piromyces sp. E2]
MKLYLLLLLSIILINNVLGKTWYHKAYTGYYITADKYCKEFFMCKYEFTKFHIFNMGKKYLDDCVNGFGQNVGQIFEDKGVNPFTSCTGKRTMYSGELTLYDCRNSFYNQGHETSFKKISEFNQKVQVSYFTEIDFDRVFSGHGWCKFKEPHGRCGKDNGLSCKKDYCCSKYGYCGNTKDYCNKNQQLRYTSIVSY